MDKSWASLADDDCVFCVGEGKFVRDDLTVVCHWCNGTGKKKGKKEYAQEEKREH